MNIVMWGGKIFMIQNSAEKKSRGDVGRLDVIAESGEKNLQPILGRKFGRAYLDKKPLEQNE